MSTNSPSLLALLGLVAVAGYQNREAIGRMLGHATSAAGDVPPAQGGAAAAPAGSAGSDPQASLGTTLGTGLRDLLNHFQGTAAPAVNDSVQSWVGPGQNQPIAAPDLRAALGPDVVATLAQRAGISEDELLQRLTAALPQTVDQMTPDGRVPAAGQPGRALPPSIDALLRGA